jgi:uncharacterized protein YjbI with pentapeptide repeats
VSSRLETLLLEHERWLAGLPGGVRFRGNALAGKRAVGRSLARADLEAANLAGSFLINCDVSAASAERVRLSEAILLNCNLRGADLRGAVVLGGTWQNVAVQGADLRGVDFTTVELVTGLHVDGATLLDVGQHEYLALVGALAPLDT